MLIEQVPGDVSWPMIQPLSARVYPPEVLAEMAWRHVDWAHAAWRLLTRDDAGTVVSTVGAYHRVADLDGRPLRLGGIGGVMTHPDFRRRGLVRAAMAQAVALFAEEGQEAGLLFCEGHNVPVYAALGWRLFQGGTIVEQPHGPVVFTGMHAMVCNIRGEAPRRGRLDLRGKPW